MLTVLRTEQKDCQIYKIIYLTKKEKKVEVMNKKELIMKTVEALREHDVKKAVVFPKQTFHITDDEGNRKDFSVRKTNKSVGYTSEDVRHVIETCLDVITESIKNGEEVTVSGFGTLGLHYRGGRTIGGFDGKQHTMKAHYVPKFWYGKNLKNSADLYRMSVEDENGDIPNTGNIKQRRRSHEEGVE